MSNRIIERIKKLRHPPFKNPSVLILKKQGLNLGTKNKQRLKEALTYLISSNQAGKLVDGYVSQKLVSQLFFGSGNLKYDNNGHLQNLFFYNFYI